MEGTRQKRSLVQINNRLFCPDANTDRGKEEAAFSLYFKREERLKGEVETRFLPSLFRAKLNIGGGIVRGNLTGEMRSFLKSYRARHRMIRSTV